MAISGAGGDWLGCRAFPVARASSSCEMSWLTQLLAMQWFVHITKPPPHLAQMNASSLKQPRGYWLKRKPEPLWWISSLHPILASRDVPDHKVGMEFSLLLPLWHLICEDISLHFYACQSSSFHKHYIHLNAKLLLYKKFRRYKLKGTMKNNSVSRSNVWRGTK